MADRVLLECVEYFKSNKGYKKLMTEIKEKYKSLGVLGGTISVIDMTPSEKEAITNLMGQKFYFNKSSTINVRDVIDSLENTKFENVDFYEFLCLYFNETIVANKELREKALDEKSQFFDKLSTFVSSEVYYFVIGSFGNKTGGLYNLINNKYNEDSKGENLKRELVYLDNIIKSINVKEKNRLAILSANITNDPHYLDEGTYLNKLLTYYLCSLTKCKLPANAEEKNYLLYNNGILKDDISNNTLLAGISGFIDNNFETEHRGWKELCMSYEPYFLSLNNLTKLNSLKALSDKVIIIENPTVFMKLHEIIIKRDNKYGLICSNGQINTSTLLILDMLYNSGCKFYYTGDFDPEGLIILNKLLIRFKDSIEPLFYSLDDYKKSLSENTIDDRRLKQLDKINDVRLQEIIKYMKSTKRAGYQETLVDKLNF